MKQKRKVKSLIPHKIDKSGTLLTVLLLILSVVLCLGSASLMTVSVWAIWNDDDFNITYSWLDDKVEVLYELQFTDPETLWWEPVNELHVKNGSLYLTPNQVIFNETGVDWDDNVVDTGKYINVLWWEWNIVDADGVAIIAWYKNIVDDDSANSSVLWWDENELGWFDDENRAPSVMAWWKNNKIIKNSGDVIIWWENNQISGSSNSFILWWEGNEVDWWSNVIVWWKNVKVSGVDNVFAFSDTESDFEPESSNAFYLDLTNWVGISADSTRRWVSVSGTVWFWDVVIAGSRRIPCDENNIWLEWSWDWCLVWCTEVSMNEWKWELLDRWSLCEDKCARNSKCLYTPVDTGLDERLDYSGACITDHIYIENATRCTTWENESYKNVAFEGVLIDREEPCPTTGNNKCVFRCDPGFHLTWDIAWWSSEVMCYRDCELPWDHTKKIKHNETVTGYNIEDVYCSNDEYVFPYQLTPKVANAKSPETCGNFNHKKTLICNWWTLYILKNGKADMWSRTEAEKYEFESCNLHNYRCNTWVYTLTPQQVMEEKEDQPKNGNRAVADRTATLQWIRWQYKLCLDYNANPTDPTKNWESCLTGTVTPTSYHYKFERCQDWYTLYEWVCRKKCHLTWTSNTTEWYDHATLVTWYQATSATCTEICQAEALVCNDGNWRAWTLDGEETTQYPYNYCTLKDKVCEGRYNVEESIVNNYGQNSIYNHCDPFSGNGIFECVKQNTLYELVGCSGNYHTENGHESRNKWCISNTKNVNCDKPTGKYSGSGRYIDADVEVQWQWWWNEWHWTSPAECVWECDAWYHLEGRSCVANFKTVDCKHGTIPSNSHHIDTWVIVWWINWSWEEPQACSWDCNSGYVNIDQVCEEMEWHLTVTKQTTSTPENGETYALGETITYNIKVENNWNVPITDITVTDDKTRDEWDVPVLAPWDRWSTGTSYVVTEADILVGEVVNVANASWTSPEPGNPNAAVDPGVASESTDDPLSHLTVTIEPTSTTPEGWYALWDTVTYKITVLNDWNLSISNIDVIGQIQVRDELKRFDWWLDGVLAPGESRVLDDWFYVITEAGILEWEVVIEATARWTSPDPDMSGVLVDTGVASEPTEHASPSLRTSISIIGDPANGVGYASWEGIKYNIEIMNNWNLTVTDIVLRDVLTNQTWPIDSLVPWESKEFETPIYYLRCEDVEIIGENKFIKNEVTATWTTFVWQLQAPIYQERWLVDGSSCQ